MAMADSPHNFVDGGSRSRNQMPGLDITFMEEGGVIAPRQPSACPLQRKFDQSNINSQRKDQKAVDFRGLRAANLRQNTRRVNWWPLGSQRRSDRVDDSVLVGVDTGRFSVSCER